MLKIKSEIELLTAAGLLQCFEQIAARLSDAASVSSEGWAQQRERDRERVETEFCWDSRRRHVTGQSHHQRLKSEQFPSFHHYTGWHNPSFVLFYVVTVTWVGFCAFL